MDSRLPVAPAILAIAFVFLAVALVLLASPAQAADREVPLVGDGSTGSTFRTCRVDAFEARARPVADAQPCVPPQGLKPLAWEPSPCQPVCGTCNVPPCPPKCADRKCWEVRVGVMGWLPGIDGRLTLAGQETTVDFPWEDWFDNLDKVEFAVELFGSVRYRNWRVQAGWITMVLGDSVPLPDQNGTPLDAELTLNVIKATAGYDVWRVPLSCTSCYPCFTTHLFAGARYYNMGVELTGGAPTAAPRTVDREWDWVDPIVGTNLYLDLNPCWTAFLKADIGGFGVGSDLCWSVGVGIEWRIWKHLGLQAGWNVLDVDYETGSGTDRFVFDANLNGPFVNIVAIF